MKHLATPLIAVALCGCVSHARLPGAQPAPLRHDLEVEIGLQYARGLALDLYRPEGTGPFPAVVTVHGGGWDARDRSDMERVANKLARRGYLVANIQYRLAPEHLYPAAVDDVRDAVRWLRANARELRVDPQRIAGWGYSAGAHLVALAATRTDDPNAALQAVVAGGLPARFSHYPASPIITRFIGRGFEDARAAWIEASPADQAGPGTAPMFLYHGTWDRLVLIDDALAMKAALDQAGVPAELYRVHGAGHLATFVFGFGAERAGIDFLDRRFR